MNDIFKQSLTLSQVVGTPLHPTLGDILLVITPPSLQQLATQHICHMLHCKISKKKKKMELLYKPM